MSDKLNWQTATDKDKIQAIIEHGLQLPIMQQRSAHAPCAYYAYDSDSSLNLDCWVIFGGKMTPFMRKKFDPLHNLSDAMLLVEHMRKRPDFRGFSLYTEDDGWRAYYELSATKGASCKKECDAICLAALRVLGLVEEQQP